VTAPLVPLVVGITGHRDLRQSDRMVLEERVRSVFRTLHGRYPSTPLLVLSALAEGADRLAARVALEVGARLIVPLPMPRTVYETDFQAEGSLAEFAALLARAERWFELPLVEGNNLENIRKPGKARDRQYAQLGMYIAEHSQVLVALWDGVPASLLAGTAQTVAFKLEGGGDYSLHLRSPLDPVETGPVYHVVTPRLSNPRPDGTPFALQVRAPSERNAADDMHAKAYSRIETFNRDILRMAPKLVSKRNASKAKLLPDDEAEPVLEVVRDGYGLADALAMHYQRKTLQTLGTVFWGVFAIAVVFAIYAHVWNNLWVLLTYLAALGAVNMFWLAVKRRDYQNRYQDYRALAEGLRVQLFWGLAGLPDSAAANYLRKQRSELEWIRYALRNWSLPIASLTNPTAFGDPIKRAERTRLVLRRWIEPQYDYFVSAARRDQASHARLDRFAAVLFRVGVALAVVSAGVFVAGWAAARVGYPPLLELAAWLQANHRVKELLTALMAVAWVPAALLHNYAEKRALSEHAKHYARMSLLFANARQRLAALVDGEAPERAETLIRSLGSEALVENGDWVILHRERPLELPEAEGAQPSVILKAFK
jgi:hypothetical protein